MANFRLTYPCSGCGKPVEIRVGNPDADPGDTGCGPQQSEAARERSSSQSARMNYISLLARLTTLGAAELVRNLSRTMSARSTGGEAVVA